MSVTPNVVNVKPMELGALDVLQLIDRSGARVFTDGATTTGSPNLSSAAGAVFTLADQGQSVTGAGIPTGTTILTYTSPTAVVMSANATATASAVSVTLGGILYDVGATKGGCELIYTPTFYPFDIDQALTPPDVARTKEEVALKVGGLTQFQMSNIGIAMSQSQAYTSTTPGTPNVDTITVGGDASVPILQLKFSTRRRKSPSGTPQRINGTINGVYSAKAITIPFSREKPTELSGIEFAALSDMTQSVGARLYTLTREWTALTA